MRGILRFLLALALLGFGLSFVIEGSFFRRSTNVQLIDRRPEGNQLRGKPVRIVDVPKSAVLADAPGDAPKLVDAATLKPPILLMDEIQRLAHITRLGCLLTLVATGFGLRRLDTLHIVAP